jgi:hypothetical protein
MSTLDEKRDEIELENIDVRLDIDERAAAAGAHPPIDLVAEKKLLRKVDLHVIPILSILFLMAFLDRTNIGTVFHLYLESLIMLTKTIGNAKIQGLEKDLKMKGSDYNIALFIFFVPYILFEVPSNIIIKRIKPSTWLSSIMVLWGELHAIATNFRADMKQVSQQWHKDSSRHMAGL